MSLLKKTIEAAKSQSITSCDIITKDELLKLFVSLRPHYDLDDEAILELFQMTDERKEGAIKEDQVQKILDTILSIEEPNVAEQEPDSESDCVSIYLKQSGKLSLSQKRVDLKTNLEQNPTIMPSEQRASFDLNKIREVKSIFEMCESGKGHVSFEHIKNFIKEYSSGSCTIDELVETFYQMKQEDQDIITKETFLLRMNKIERTVLNFCSKEEDEEQKSLDKESFEPICHFENGREVFVEGLEQEIKLILEKVDIVMNQTEKRVNEIDIIAVLKEIPSMFSHLEKKIKQNENLFKEQRDMMSEHLKRENKLLERIGDLEMNLDSAKGFFEDMQYQNDALCEINQELELKIQVQEHIKNDLKNKNIEIVELEIKVRRMARQSEELRNQVSQIQEEKEVISKELQMLLEQLNKDDNTETIATRASTQSNYAIEIEMLKLELSNVTKNFKKEKEYLNNLISELETQLKSIKNFVEEVRLEKVKLQEELKAVQERNLGESVVTQKERRDTSNILRMYLGEDYEEKLKSRRVSKQVSNLGESLPNLKRSVYSYNYENKEIIGNEQAEEKLVDPPENAGLSAIKENGEEEDRQAKGKVLHHTSTAPLEISGVIYYPRSGHNLRNLSKDYLSIRNHHQIIKILKDYKEAADRVMCFSDYIYTINSKEQREHRILFISGEALYCLHPKRNYEVQKRIPLNSIHQITVITSSAGLCMIHAKDSPEYYAIDSYKRLHLIQYLQEIFKVRGMESFSMAYQEKLLEAPSPHILAKKTEIYKTFMNPELQPVYKNAAKCGELYMKSGMIFNSVKKYFFVLTNLGLICFKNSGDKRPIDFIPVIDYSLIDLPNNMIDKKYWFEIKFPFSSFEVELAAGSELEKREWISAIKKTQKQQIDI